MRLNSKITKQSAKKLIGNNNNTQENSWRSQEAFHDRLRERFTLFGCFNNKKFNSRSFHNYTSNKPWLFIFLEKKLKQIYRRKNFLYSYRVENDLIHHHTRAYIRYIHNIKKIHRDTQNENEKSNARQHTQIHKKKSHLIIKKCEPNRDGNSEGEKPKKIFKLKQMFMVFVSNSLSIIWRTRCGI